MGYKLEALLAEQTTLDKCNLEYAFIELPFFLGLIPLTNERLVSLGIKRLLLQDFNEILVDNKLDELGMKISKNGKVAFIQANIFASTIWHQACAVWDKEERIHLEIGVRAINHAIIEINKNIRHDNRDAFECLNLGRFRTTNEWISYLERIKLDK